MKNDTSRLPAAATDEQATLRQRKRRKRRICWALFFLWFFVGAGLFHYMWENRHTRDEDGKSLLWRSYDREENE